MAYFVRVKHLILLVMRGGVGYAYTQSKTVRLASKETAISILKIDRGVMLTRANTSRYYNRSRLRRLKVGSCTMEMRRDKRH